MVRCTFSNNSDSVLRDQFSLEGKMFLKPSFDMCTIKRAMGNKCRNLARDQ